MTAINNLNATVTSYMLGDVDGGAVSVAQHEYLSAWISAVAALDAIDPREDPEKSHSDAEEILISLVPHEVAEAYRRLTERAPWWACA